MTEFLDAYQQYYRSGVYDKMLLPPIPVGQCLVCQRRMSDIEMQAPPGYLTTRSMHKHCYEVFISKPTVICPICGADIMNKVRLQRGEPRSLRHRMCSRETCLAKFAFAHASVHGIAQRDMAQHGMTQAQYEELLLDIGEIPPLDVEDEINQDEDFVDAEHEDLGQRAIPYLGKQMTLDDLFNQASQLKGEKQYVRVR